MVCQRLIEKLRMIVREDYGRDLSIKEATDIAENVVGYFDLLAKMLFYEEVETNKEEGLPPPDG